ncbi:DUF424 family protein [Candidatus Woesearchaeota archaeon]|jgi:hypothetical protein|nr:DUF424 family protein [Candidatus Woesearchaeota archaeon]MBT4387353.1 DUF424 family protein [Candidatus Woesearchaeota archaeon]MBT4595492.1 DUF424 family protein [Candidatus Woesearchaeota archaeon]MBT5740678.1 DUF424 family protein [Candidatus Woesearchaeota archaeon]MBT6506088.1 DUF424 family protein [Candidatus Woesearchaeota archaeon]
MLYNLHETENGILLTLCDKELLGLKLKSEFMEIKISSQIYGGKNFNENTINNIEFDSINAIGKKSVSVLKKKGLLKNNETVFIQNNPYVHIEKQF